MTTFGDSFVHVLGAAPTFVHPNGNIYFVVNGKERGTRQHLFVYRLRNGAFELVQKVLGGGGPGAVSPAQLAMGGAVIDFEGALVVGFSAPTFEQPEVWRQQFARYPGVDAPWSYGTAGAAPQPQPTPQPTPQPVADPRVAELTARVNDLAAALAVAQKAAKGAQDAAAALQKAHDKLAARVVTLEGRPATAGMSRDEVWQLSADRMYFELTQSNGGVVGAIRALIAETLKGSRT